MDVATMQRHTRQVDLEGIDFDAFDASPLGEDALRCLQYMHDVEFHTVCYLRDLLVSPAHRDATVTAFLTFWNWEEYWHGEAISRVLAKHGRRAGPPRIEDRRAALGWKDRVSPALHLLGSLVAGQDYTAVHMTWGAVNEWGAQAAYARLAQRSGHPVLSDLLRRIMRQEGRHVDFYSSQAVARLERSRRARTLTRATLQRFWAPVGSTIMPPSEVAFMVGYLFGDDEGIEYARRIDRRVDRLPGLEGLSVVERSVQRLLPRYRAERSATATPTNLATAT